MADAVITLSDKPPTAPQADFAFEIDFQRGVGPASRVFLATHDFIRACEILDSDLVRSIDSNIETVLVLEDIEAGSIKTWLRNTLSATEDNALKTLDWKPIVGKYLVRAKYATLRWLDDGSPKTLPDLRREVQKIAAETDVRHLPDYVAPSPATLIRALRDFQGVKDHLLSGDRASFLTQGDSVDLNLSVRLSVEDIEAMAVARTIGTPSTEMILAVKKPDYLGESKWELRHGRKTISVRIEDTEWLKRFQSREIDVRPGDALRCSVRIDMEYGFDNELIAEKYTILAILDVLVDRFRETRLPFDE